MHNLSFKWIFLITVLFVGFLLVYMAKPAIVNRSHILTEGPWVSKVEKVIIMISVCFTKSLKSQKPKPKI